MVLSLGRGGERRGQTDCSTYYHIHCLEKSTNHYACHPIFAGGYCWIDGVEVGGTDIRK